MNWKQFILFCSTSNLRHQCKYNFYARINENSLALYTHIYFSFSLSLSFSFASSYASFVVALPSFPKPKLYNLLPLSLFVILTIHWYNCSFSICFLSLSLSFFTVSFFYCVHHTSFYLHFGILLGITHAWAIIQCSSLFFSSHTCIS